MWYGVCVVFRSVHEKPVANPIWQEVVVLVEGEAEDEARRNAIAYARRQEVTYEVLGGDRVSWLFDSVLAICDVTEPIVGSGTEVFSRFLKDSEVASLKTKLS